MTALKLFTKLINSILVIALDSTDKDSNGIFHGKYKYGFTSCLILKKSFMHGVQMSRPSHSGEEKHL